MSRSTGPILLPFAGSLGKVGHWPTGEDEAMQHIFWGVLIISIGLYLGSSIFLGDFSPLSFVFDGLGLFWIGKGGLAMYRSRNAAPSPSSSDAT